MSFNSWVSPLLTTPSRLFTIYHQKRRLFQFYHGFRSATHSKVLRVPATFCVHDVVAALFSSSGTLAEYARFDRRLLPSPTQRPQPASSVFHLLRAALPGPSRAARRLARLIFLAQDFFEGGSVSLSSCGGNGTSDFSVEARVRRRRDRIEEEEALRTCEEFLAVVEHCQQPCPPGVLKK